MYRRRWWMLLVLSISLIIVVIDTTILNVTIPTLQRELGASASTLQWIVDSFVLAVAGLLLTMGALGDKFGRKRALLAGLVVYGLASLLAAYSATSGQLIAARVFMGVGGALITPATLSVIAYVFPPEERAKAIGIWTAVAALGIPIGPVLGGYLLENYWWGSVFFVNVPTVLLVLGAAFVLVPESRAPTARGLDFPGMVLSTAALSALVFGIIEAPSKGWSDSIILGAFAGALTLGAAFIVYELKTDHPMLNIRLFRARRLSIGAMALMITFLTLIGMAFILTQYLQIVRAYTPFDAGVRVVPLALGAIIGSMMSFRLVSKFGSNIVIAGGLMVITVALVVLSLLDVSTAYLVIGLALFVFGVGMGNTMAPATDAIMGSIPTANSGVGGAINNSSRQVGAALGVGILGSILNSFYSSNLDGKVTALPAEAAAAAKNSIGAAVQVSTSVEGPIGDSFRSAANAAFVDAFGVTMLFGAAIAFIGALVVLRFMPARGPV